MLNTSSVFMSTRACSYLIVSAPAHVTACKSVFMLVNQHVSPLPSDLGDLKRNNKSTLQDILTFVE